MTGAERQRRYRERQAAKEGRELRPSGGRPRSADHGTRSRYVAGCRCDACTEANTAYCRALRQR